MSSGERGRGARGTGGAGCRGSPGLPLGSSRVVMGSPSPTAHRDAPISILTSRAWGCDALPGRNTLVLAIGTCCTSFFAGFATFSVLGHMAWRNQVPVGSVTDSGMGSGTGDSCCAVPGDIPVPCTGMGPRSCSRAHIQPGYQLAGLGLSHHGVSFHASLRLTPQAPR